MQQVDHLKIQMLFHNHSPIRALRDYYKIDTEVIMRKCGVGNNNKRIEVWCCTRKEVI